MENPVCTILIPNFKTPELTKLCLRLLYKHCDHDRVRVIVVDNDSRDASLDYLRNLKWITLIERHNISHEIDREMHARALDLAFQEVTTPYVMVMHTDTMIMNPGWLDFLKGKLEADPQNGGVGSWKMEHVSRFKAVGQKVESCIRKMLGREVLPDERYFRSHCAFYRTQAVKESGSAFYGGEVPDATLLEKTAGASLFRAMTAKGWKMPFLNTCELEKYLLHLNHATMILNPSPNDRRTSTPQARKRLELDMEKLDYRAILADDTLDGASL